MNFHSQQPFLSLSASLLLSVPSRTPIPKLTAPSPLSLPLRDCSKEIVHPHTPFRGRAIHARPRVEHRNNLFSLRKMHSSLTIKTFMDASPGHCRVRAAGLRRPSQSRVNPGPRCVVARCSLEENGGGSTSGSGPVESTSSFRSRSQTYALLKQQMEVAAQSEDYEEAARIRDSLKLFEEREPVLRLRRLLKQAVEDDRFEDAAKYRDELKEIEPHSLLKCSSDATTLGIRVQVRSVYIEGRSQPSKGQYFFAYRIRITNNSDRPVQLLRRHWIITNANGKTENFWGNGVIGEQPVILPSTGFEYSSACPLATPNGRMEGEFELKHIDKVGSRTFNVAIAPFCLAIPGDESSAF